MTSFDFITDEEFRTSLENDFREMSMCIQNGAYKAAVVLAGSIVEAVLIDYVVAENIIIREEALKLDFGKVLTLCKDKKIISNTTSDLSSAIKGYRNLIHPGRSIRLNESVSKETSEVSSVLVNIILSEIEKQKKENYGYTAEQIVSKIKNDSGVSSILPLLLKKTKQIELERLMFKHLPEAYTKNWDEYMSSIIDEGTSPSEHIQSALISCFRLSFEAVDENVKKKVATWFAKIRGEESDTIISGYGTGFIKASDMFYMNKDDMTLVKHHMIGKLSEATFLGSIVLDSLSGIGKYLEVSDVQKFIDPLVRTICAKTTLARTENKIISIFEIESPDFSEEVKKTALNRVDYWGKTFNERNQQTYVSKVNRIRDSIEEFPF